MSCSCAFFHSPPDRHEHLSPVTNGIRDVWNWIHRDSIPWRHLRVIHILERFVFAPSIQYVYEELVCRMSYVVHCKIFL